LLAKAGSGRIRAIVFPSMLINACKIGGHVFAVKFGHVLELGHVTTTVKSCVVTITVKSCVSRARM
jgi:hypothetical protein